ncbi:MAG: flagellar hook-associated protein FlgK, partial [Cellulosilyticum sp.]|nr:flagellar hook-associated protein FlgK [Cellulosilyticum sp.]
MAFFELNIAMSGLFAAQRGLQVTSNNISNANTTGYSRQVLEQKASKPLSGLSVGMTGTGVITTGVNRVRDSYIDQKLWTQNPVLGEHNMKVTQSSMIETAFGEPSESGFTKAFDGVFSSMSDLSNNPSSKEHKVVVCKQMETFAGYFNNIAGALKKQQKDVNFEIKGLVDEINSLATRIQSLNEQIFNAEIYGSEASTFRDERDKCIDRLSKIVNVQVSEDTYESKGATINRLSVKINGQTLVDHLNVNTLDIKVREDKLNEHDEEGLYDVVWNTGGKLNLNSNNMSGELKGLIDMRDGIGTNNEGKNSYTGIGYYMQRLDTYVRTFAKTMNEQYSTGLTDKKALFTYSAGDTVASESELKTEDDYKKITAANFSVSRELLESPYDMRTLYDETNPSDTSFMLDLIAQKDNK